jgi:chemotaxis methyl-accepting protein methylase
LFFQEHKSKSAPIKNTDWMEELMQNRLNDFVQHINFFRSKNAFESFKENILETSEFN